MDCLHQASVSMVWQLCNNASDSVLIVNNVDIVQRAQKTLDTVYMIESQKLLQMVYP